MAYSTLHLDPNGYSDAASKARQAATEIETAAHSALKSLSGLAHMGGNDQSGGRFARSYDANAAQFFQHLGVLCSALSATSAGLDASAASHAAAEAANAAGSSGSGAGLPAPSPARTVTFGTPASAYGGTNILPQGWTFIQSLVSATWPDGDTDKMRRAARAWTDLADDLDSVRGRQVDSLLVPLEGFTAPDIAAIETKTQDLAPATRELAEACTTIAEQCTKYAEQVDDAHAEAIRELTQFMVTSAAAIGISALLTPFTAGISDLVGGGAVAAKAIATAADISETLGTLLTRTIAVTSKVVELGKSAGLAGKLMSRPLVFAAKSAYTGTIWGIGNSMGDYAVNGDDAHFGTDFGMAYIGGSVGEAFDGLGKTVASGLRKSIDSAAKQADSLPAAGARDGLETVGESDLPRPEAASARPARASSGPRHSNSPKAMGVSNGVRVSSKIIGAAGGTYANKLLFAERETGEPGGEAANETKKQIDTLKEIAKDAAKPSIETYLPKHVPPIKPVTPLP